MLSQSIQVDSSWNIKIGDFGLARINSDTHRQKTLSKMERLGGVLDVLDCSEGIDRASVYSTFSSIYL